MPQFDPQGTFMKPFTPVDTGLLLQAQLPESDALSVSLALTSDEPFLNERGSYLYSESLDGAGVIFALGKKRDLRAFRFLGGDVIRRLQKTETPAAAIDFPADMGRDEIGAFLEGLLLGAFSFDRYKAEKAAKPCRVSVDPQFADLVAEKNVLCAAVNQSRDWAHEPASVINPVTLAERAVALAKDYDLEIKVMTDDELRAMGANAITAVGQGSKTPSRLITLSYKGTRPGKPVVLVGKAITFDAGGYSIKPTESMVGMKYDKSGAMTVLATLRAAAELKLAQPLVGVICAAENMLSENSYRPDDILTSLSGKTIEVISTDAEGRLVLADGLTYAQRNFEPRAMIDLATLTGGVMIALGRVRAGLLSNNDELAKELFDAGERTDERLWRLPLDEDYKELIKGKDADIKNSAGRGGGASTIVGGIFLKEFVEDAVPWAHLDIAAVADTDEATPICAKGGTGFGVRLLVDYLASLG